jgi:Ca-activated chloride channel family protein
VAVLLAGAAAMAGAPAARAQSFLDYWLTPDQQGQRLEAAGRFAEAAARYADPLRRGVAHYRAGDFEAAADAFARLDTPQAAFNRGNALVLLGRYEEAVDSYRQALDLSPAWDEARENLELARLRGERLAARDDADQGTGGRLEADEVVFDRDGRRGGERQSAEEAGGGMSAAEVEALWLRRVQTSPADFLRAKFAYQLAAEGRR